MPQMTPPKLPVLGILLVAMVSLAVACGGNTIKLTPVPFPTPTLEPTDTPAPAPALVAPPVEPTVAPTTAPGATTAPVIVIVPTTEPTTAPVLPPTTEPTTATVPPEDRTIELRFMIVKRDPNNEVTVLEKDGVLTGDDHYGIFFEPAAEAWVYVLQRDSTAKIDVLFPNPKFSDQTNPVPGGTSVWIPNDINTWFTLDENVGPESFFVVAAREQDKGLEAIIARPDRVAVLGGLEGLLRVKDRGVGGSETLDEEPRILSDGSSTVPLEQQLLQSEADTFVYALPFKHE